MTQNDWCCGSDSQQKIGGLAFRTRAGQDILELSIMAFIESLTLTADVPTADDAPGNK